MEHGDLAAQLAVAPSAGGLCAETEFQVVTCVIHSPDFILDDAAAGSTTIATMGEVFRGSESVASGAISRGRLRWNYRPIFPDVHVPSGHQGSLRTRTVGAWLWSKRKAVITGRAAAALHGALWVNESSPIELFTSNNRPPSGIITRTERIAHDEVLERRGMAVATPQRTAFDLGRFLPRDAAVAHLDTLARATGITADNLLPLAIRYKGARGVRRFKTAIDLMDAGAQSPQETRLRLLFIDAGFPRAADADTGARRRRLRVRLS